MLVQGIGAAVTVLRVHMDTNEYPLLLQSNNLYYLLVQKHMLPQKGKKNRQQNLL